MLPDKDKAKEQLVSELTLLRQRITELETLESEHKQAEKMPSAAEDYYRMFELFPIGVTVLDMKGMILYCNSAVYTIGGFSEDDIVGKHFSKISPLRLEDIPKFVKVFASLVRGKISKPFETAYQQKGGTTGWTEVHISLAKIGGKRRILAIQHDITERKQAEGKLKQEFLLRNILLDNLPCIAMILKKGTREIVASNEYARNIGAVPGKKCYETCAERDDPCPFCLAPELWATGEPRQLAGIDYNGKNYEGRWLPYTEDLYIHYIFDTTERKQVEEEVRVANEKLRLLLSASAAVIYTAKPSDDYGATFVSENVTQITGYKAQEFIENSSFWIDHVHPEDLQKVYDAVPRLFENPRGAYEYRFKHGNGDYVWIRDEMKLVRDEKGNPIEIVGYWVDITERKQAEEALRESEGRYRALVNLGAEVGEAITMGQDTEQGEGILIFISDEWSRITGYSKRELLGTSFFDLVHPKDRGASLERHHRKMHGEAMSGLFELSIVRKDGTEVPIELTSAYTTYQGERAEVAYSRDITERKQAEEELRESEERYRNIVETMNDGLVIITPEGVLTDVNSCFTRMTGWTKQDLVGTKVPYKFWVKEDTPRLMAALTDLQARDKIVEAFEQPLQKKDGGIIWTTVNSTIVHDNEGKQNMFFGVFRDITEHKRAEEREEQLQQELSVSMRLAAVGELAAGVGHEINSPLTGILGFSERLLRKSTDEKIRLDLERIHDEAQRIAKVMDNLRTFTHRREPEKQCSDINDILQKTLELRVYELKTGNIEIVIDLARNLPEIEIDFHQIQEVFLNIILNAEQVMTEAQSRGKLTIKTVKIKNYVKISFTDDGPGILAEHRDKLFDPFFTTRGEQGGTGLGLSVCHSIVTGHGGKLYTRSKPGEGATFFVDLPCP